MEETAATTKLGVKNGKDTRWWMQRPQYGKEKATTKAKLVAQNKPPQAHVQKGIKYYKNSISQ